jgi:pilus assembly protein Flp/PilA
MLKKLVASARTLQPDQSGSTAIEYALIASGIAAAIIGIIAGLGGSVNAMFLAVKSAL